MENKEVGRKKEVQEEGDGRQCLIFNERRHKCNMIHYERAIAIGWKLIKTIPHCSVFQTS